MDKGGKRQERGYPSPTWGTYFKYGIL